MTTFAVSRTKNEADVIEASVTKMLAQVDHVLIADGSTDGTREILEQMPVTLFDDQTKTYKQAEQMTYYAGVAREMGADWVVPFDADEIWFPTEGRIADRLAELPDEVLIAEAALLDHRATALDDLDEPDPLKRLGWRCVEALPLRKVAVRALDGLSIHGGNHGASFDGVRHAPRVTDAISARHFPYRSPEQFIRKISVGAPALRDPEAPEGFGVHWRLYGDMLEAGGEQALRDHFYEHFYFEDPESDPRVIYDPCP